LVATEGSAQQKGLRLDVVSAASAFSSCQTEQQWKAHWGG
jgi:hypothetical protein